MKKKNIRMIADITMTVLLPMLMAYSLIGEKFHEVVGTVMFVLFIVHHILNRQWYKTVFKGKYTPRRVFQTILDTFLLLFMIAQPISGILMSKHLYTFVRVTGASAKAREIHLLFAYWGFALLCIHAGMHLGIPLGKLKRKNKGIWTLVLVLLEAVSAYGIYAFVKRQIAEYMFLKTAFVFLDYSEPRVYFFLDYISMMILFATLGMLVADGLGWITVRSKKEKEA